MALKGLISVCSQKSSFLVGKAYLRKADACNHNKKIISQQYIILKLLRFLKSNTVLKALFAIIPLNEGL